MNDTQANSVAIPTEQSGVLSSTGRRAALWALTLSCVATAVFFHRAVFTERIFIARDILRVYYPLHRFWVEQVRSGHFPDWYPYDGLGQPYVGMVISGAFHPTNLLYLLLPIGEALKLNTLLCYPFAFLGTFLLCREWELEAESALLAGILFAFNGYMVGITNNLLYLMAAATFPWAFWAAQRYFRKPGLLRAATAALLVALVLLAGDSQSFAIASACLIPLCFAQADLTIPQKLARLATLYVLTALFALPQIVAAFQVLGAGDPTHNSLTTALIWSLNPVRIYDLLIGPAFAETSLGTAAYQKISRALTTDTSTLWVDSLYIGVSAVVLSVTGLFARRRQWRAWLLAIAGVILLWLALGVFGGLYRLLFSWIPLWRPFRYPEKITPYLLFVVSLGAAFGLQECLRNRAARRSVGFVLVSIAGSLFAFAQFRVASWFAASVPPVSLPALEQTVHATLMQSLLVSLLLGAILLAPLQRRPRAMLVVLAVFVDLFVANQGIYQLAIPDILELVPTTTARVIADPTVGLGKERVASAANAGVIPQGSDLGVGELTGSAMLTELAPDTPSLRDVESMDVYLPAATLGLAELEREYPTWLGSHTDLYSVRYVSVSPGAEINARQVPVIQSTSFGSSLLRNVSPLPRAYLAEPHCVGSIDEAIAALRSSSLDWRKRALVECPNGAPPFPAPGATPLGGDSKIIHYAPNQVDILASPAQPSLLVLNDAYYPGWTASVDGHPAPILRTNAAVRGVALPEGIHHIRFRYRTPHLRLALTLASLALAVAFGLGGAIEVRRRIRSALRN